MDNKLNTITYKGYIVKKKKLTQQQLKDLKKDLTVSPKANIYSDNTEKYKLYTESTNYICMPRYFGEKRFGKGKIKESTGGDKKNKLVFSNATLRPKQKPIVKKCLEDFIKNGGGILNIPCGWGKTLCTVYMMCKLSETLPDGIKVLVVAGKDFLLGQWEETITRNTNATIGIIQGKKYDVDKDVVLATIQSLYLKDFSSELMNQFDMVIYDECHHCPAKKFCKALQKTNFRYTIGLSATFDRNDGLIKICNWYLGDIMYSADREPDDNVTVKVMKYISSDPKYQEITQWVKGKITPSSVRMTSMLCELDCRNNFIVEILKNLLSVKNRKILVLSARLKQLDILKKKIDKVLEEQKKLGNELGNMTTSKYVGGTKRKILDESAKANLIFATYDMAAEGLDISDLNTLVFASPKKDIEQSVGRILRKKPEEGDPKPLIIDIFDMISIYERKWNSERLRYYSKNNYTCLYFPAFNDSLYSIREYLKDIYSFNTDKINERRDKYIKVAYGDKMLKNQKNNNYELFPENLFDGEPLMETVIKILENDNNIIIENDSDDEDEDFLGELRMIG